MAYADRWLLPDGVEEILPGEAQQIESLRRQLLDLFNRWGYQLVIPPLVEYTDSLLIGLGRDLDLLTFKVTDQLSGRAMGIRADITPQIARMDAHSLKQQGANRLCYSGHVLHTKSRTPLGTRSPIQVGAELYGEPGLSADCEVISLLLESLIAIGLSNITVEVGHVKIYRALVAAAQLSDMQQETLFDLLQRKAVTEIAAWVESNVSDTTIAGILLLLPRLAGGRECLNVASETLRGAPAEALAALAELEQLAESIATRYPQVQLYFDLSELPSFNYHTGIVFAAFVPGVGRTVASGGRYDSIGEVFGRARPATGFSVLDLVTLYQLLKQQRKLSSSQHGIYVEESSDPAQWQAIQELRAQGEIVVVGLSGGDGNQSPAVQCDRQMILKNGSYEVVPR